MKLCRLTGAQPYLAANVRSLGCPIYALARILQRRCRADHVGRTSGRRVGIRIRINVEFWGVGNESWGCGGEFTPEEYATEYRRFAAWLPTYGVKLKLIGAGPNGGDLGWTRRFFTKLTEKGMGQLNRMYGWALHFYSGSTGKQNASEYTENEWYDLIARSDRMESLVTEHWQVMGEIDREHRVKLIVDEWGAWHWQDADMPAGYLYAYAGTLRDALISGLNLDTFQRHADKVVCEPRPAVNTIHSLFHTYEDKFVLTPNYHCSKCTCRTPVRPQSGRILSPKVGYTRFDAQRKEMPASFWG